MSIAFFLSGFLDEPLFELLKHILFKRNGLDGLEMPLPNALFEVQCQSSFFSELFLFSRF